MDWLALTLSLRLAALTILILLPLGVVVGRLLAFRQFRGKGFAQALLALPLVLPPTVLGYYLLVAFGGDSPLGKGWEALLGHSLVFSFEGVLDDRLAAGLAGHRHRADFGVRAYARRVRRGADGGRQHPGRDQDDRHR